MTDTNEKLRAVFLAAIMVVSVFAMTATFSGAAVADDVTAVNSASGGSDTTAGQSSVTQTTDVSLDVGANGVANLTIDYGATGATVSEVTSTSDGASDLVVDSTSVSGSTVTVNVNNTAGSATTETISVTVDLDMSGASAASGADITVANESGALTATDSIDVYGVDGVSATNLGPDSSTTSISVDHSTIDPNDVDIFIVGPNGQTTTVDPTVGSGTTTTSVDVSSLFDERDGEFTVHVTGEETDGNFDANATNYQARTTFSFNNQNPDFVVDADTEWGTTYWEGQVMEVDLSGIPGVSVGDTVQIREVTSFDGQQPNSDRLARDERGENYRRHRAPAW
jgi:surface glycoprotein (TIGR04207 family)